MPPGSILPRCCEVWRVLCLPLMRSALHAGVSAPAERGALRGGEEGVRRAPQQGQGGNAASRILCLISHGPRPRPSRAPLRRTWAAQLVCDEAAIPSPRSSSTPSVALAPLQHVPSHRSHPPHRPPALACRGSLPCFRPLRRGSSRTRTRSLSPTPCLMRRPRYRTHRKGLRSP